MPFLPVSLEFDGALRGCVPAEDARAGALAEGAAFGIGEIAQEAQHIVGGLCDEYLASDFEQRFEA